MKPDLEHLRRHYAALSDEALRRVDSDDLVDDARSVYLEEVSRRKLSRGDDPGDDDGSPEPAELDFDPADGEEPDWLESAGCACQFTDLPGSQAATDAATARQVLLEAGIPCYLIMGPANPDAGHGEESKYLDYQLMVPGKRLMEATSVLDRDLFNEELESKWRALFEELPDQDLNEMDLDLMLAGYLDRVDRLKRAFEEELERRQHGRR